MPALKPARIAMRLITRGSPNRFMAKKQCPGIPVTGKGANRVMVPVLSILKKAEAKGWPFLFSVGGVTCKHAQQNALAVMKSRNI
jgi:hypothetical protein